MPSNRLILRKMVTPWITQHMDVTKATTLTHADLDNNFIFLKGEIIDSARLDGETLRLTKICGADIELNLSALTQTNEESLRGVGDVTDGLRDDLDTNVTTINKTINELKDDVESNSIWELTSDNVKSIKLKNNDSVDTTVYTPNLNINIKPTNDNSLTQVLVRDEEGNIKYKDINSFTDLNIVSGVYDIKNGLVTFTNNEGGSFEVSGFTSGMTDSYTDEAYLKGNTIYFNSNIKGDDIYSVDISPILNDVITTIGYNDRGECSLNSFTEYESIANNYTNTKNEYDTLQSNIQQLETNIADLQSQLADAKNQNPVNEELVKQLEKQVKDNEYDLARTKAQIKEIEATGDLDFVSYMPVNEVNFNCWLRGEIIKSVGYNNRGECSDKMYALYENLYRKSLKEQESIKELESEKVQAQEIRNQEHDNYISEKNQLESDLSNKQNELDVLKQIENPTSEELQQIAILEEQITYIESQIEGLNVAEEQAVNSYTQNISFLDGQINQWYNTSLRADQSGYEFFQKYTPLNEANFTCWRDMFFHEIQEEQINNIITTIGYNDRGECSLNSFTEYESIANNYTNTKNEYDTKQEYKQQLETNIADLNSQLVQATTTEERDFIKNEIDKNQEDLKQTKAQIKEIEASGDLEFVSYMPVNEVNFNCWSDSNQTEFLSNEINITNNNITEQVEIINKTINEVVENVGYNDRGVCSLNSFTDYESLAENYTNTKNEYDILQNSVQQLEVAIGDLQSQLVDAQSQVPVDEQLVNLLQENIDKNQEDLKQTKAQIKEIEASGDLDFVDYMPVNETNFNCWVNSLQDNKIEEVSKSVEVGNGNITNLFNSYTSTTQTTLEDFNKGIQSNSSNIEEVNDVIDKHINDTNNPHQTSFSNLTSTAHTHTISDVIGLQNDLDDINKAIQSIDDVYVNQGSVDALNQKLIFTNTDGGTFEVTNATALFTDNDIHVVSGLYNPSTGVVTYTTNVGTTFEVSGFAKELTDSYTTAANLNGEIISFDNNVNGDGLYSVDLSTMLQPLKDRLGDLENAEDADTFTESVSLSNNTLTFTRNDNQIYDVDLSPLNSADNDWSVDDNNMYSLPSGNVGIGTNSPQNKLHIEGSDYSDSSIRYHNKANNNNNNYWMTGMRSYANGIHGFEIGSNGDVGGGKLYIDNDGNVGIGTNHQPQSKLHVKGNIFIDNNNSSLKINNYTFPSSDGDDGQVLKTDGNGNVSWSNDNDTNTDIYTTSVSLNNNTLTFSRNDSQIYDVDLSPLNSADNDWSVNGNNMYSLPSGNVGIGTNSPQNKLHIEGSGFDNSAIRFLNTASSSFNSNTDYWVMGSRSFSSGTDGFEIGRNSETVGGKLYITNTGNVSIGNGHQPNNKLEVAGSTFITDSNSISDILTVESSFSNLTYGGASGEGTSTNNLTLKHKNKTVNGNTTSSIVLKSAGDEPSVSLTSHYTNNGTKISYNELVMNAGDSKVNIISADNNAEDAILSIQADESISFQSSIDNASSWPNDSKKTMTIDLTNDKVVIDGGFKLNNGTQGDGKVLVSDADGNTTWGYYGLKLDYVNVKNISFGSSYNLLENTFTKVLTWETQENNTPDFILPVISSESKGNEVVVKHVGGKQSIVIVAPGVTKIDKYYSSVNITNGDSITFYCDGINWYIKSHYKNIFGDIPGFFYTNDPIGDDTRIYFGSPTLSNIVTSINIAANSQKVYVHTTNNFKSANVKADDGTAGSDWFINEITGNIAANITSGIDGQEIIVSQTGPGTGGTIRFVTNDGRASTLTVTTTK